MSEVHILASLKRIKEEIPEPHRSALLLKAQERGVMWTLKCICKGGVRTVYNNVTRVFKEGEVKTLAADVASFVWQKYNLSCVAGTVHHPSTAPGAPFNSACFEEVVDETRTDLGAPMSLRQGGASLGDALVEEKHFVGKSDRARSDEVTSADVLEQAREVTGTAPRPLPNQEV